VRVGPCGADATPTRVPAAALRRSSSGGNGPLHALRVLAARRDRRRSERAGVLLALVARALAGAGAATPLVGDGPPAQRDGAVLGQMGLAVGCKRSQISHDRLSSRA